MGKPKRRIDARRSGKNREPVGDGRGEHAVNIEEERVVQGTLRQIIEIYSDAGAGAPGCPAAHFVGGGQKRVVEHLFAAQELHAAANDLGFSFEFVDRKENFLVLEKCESLLDSVGFDPFLEVCKNDFFRFEQPEVRTLRVLKNASLQKVEKVLVPGSKPFFKQLFRHVEGLVGQ